jgi:DNA repair protein RadA/Sms
MFLADRRGQAPGSMVFPSMEGARCLLVEVQALVVPCPGAGGPLRRSASGFDSARLALLLAVLERRAGLALWQSEVYVSVAGGARIAEPGADLAVCLALASAATDVALPSDLVALGEVGLGGEIRQVANTPRRLSEAARLGFGRAAVPEGAPEGGPLLLERFSTVSGAVWSMLPKPALPRAAQRPTGLHRSLVSSASGGSRPG